MTTFCIQAQGTCSREQIAIIQACRVTGDTYRFAQTCGPDEIPIGDVPFCEAVFGKQPEFKNFYPGFLNQYTERTIIHGISSDFVNNHPFFLKSATEWKSEWTSRVFVPGEAWPQGTIYISDAVTFTNEWRYYVANGELITSGWYQGNDERNDDLAAPELDIDWPAGFSGAVDFGTLDDGRIALVEAHAPFACGWYGDDPVLYLQWQKTAWEHADFWKAKQ